MIENFSIGSACIAIWTGEPTLNDCQRALDAVRRHHATIGRRVVLVSVLAPSVRMPSIEVADKMRSSWPALLAMASATQYVVMPRGFVAARLLTMLSVGFGLAFRGHDVMVSQDLRNIHEIAKGDPLFRPDEVISEIQRQLAKLEPKT